MSAPCDQGAATTDDHRVHQVHSLIRVSCELLANLHDRDALNRAADLLALAEELTAAMVTERRPQ
jgi:hypothetical protein